MYSRRFSQFNVVFTLNLRKLSRTFFFIVESGFSCAWISPLNENNGSIDLSSTFSELYIGKF